MSSFQVSFEARNWANRVPDPERSNRLPAIASHAFWSCREASMLKVLPMPLSILLNTGVGLYCARKAEASGYLPLYVIEDCELVFFLTSDLSPSVSVRYKKQPTTKTYKHSRTARNRIDCLLSRGRLRRPHLMNLLVKSSDITEAVARLLVRTVY